MVKKGETGMFSKLSGALTGPKFETSIQLSNLVHILGLDYITLSNYYITIIELLHLTLESIIISK